MFKVLSILTEFMKLLIVQMTGNYLIDIGRPATIFYYLAYNLALKDIEVSMVIQIKDEDRLKNLKKLQNSSIIFGYFYAVNLVMPKDLKKWSKPIQLFKSGSVFTINQITHKSLNNMGWNVQNVVRKELRMLKL